ncbi:MAG: palmitoyltransferase swf1 [Pycnora praestabilis]|nr:MAG: palmitoyltransferase swf1 [Pycnora praestabilis]
MLDGTHWSAGKSWSVYLSLWGWALVQDVRIGGVGLLALMTAPLAFGLFFYHVYLVWAGMTTNESIKWADWKEDAEDGLVFRAEKSQIFAKRDRNKRIEPEISWPVQSNQIVVRTQDGQPPGNASAAQSMDTRYSHADGQSQDQPKWKRVSGLREVENIYDLGFWDNLKDIF